MSDFKSGKASGNIKKNYVEVDETKIERLSDFEKSFYENTSLEEKRIQVPRGLCRRFVDGFKRALLPEGISSEGLSQREILQLQSQHSPLKQDLKARHITMIAIGGCIGSGLFITTGNSLRDGGPAGVLISFCFVGVMMFCMMQAMGELAVRYPVGGSFYVHSERFICSSWGFAMGWNYACQWLVTFPLELIASAIAINYWKDDNNGAAQVNKAAWVGLFYAIILLVNLFGVKGYGEAEFWLSLIKVIAVIGFCIFGIIVAAGGGPTHHYFGTHYWNDPGAFAHGFKGIVSAFINSAFAFAGSEFAGLVAAETDNPAKHLPRAVKQVFWRILLFYIVSIVIISCLVPYTNPMLGVSSDGSASPFVLAIKAAGVRGLPSVFNVVIILSTLSVANSSVYGCTRTMAALAVEGQAPAFLGYIDREGRPLIATIVTLAFGLIAFLVATPKYSEVFDWLVAFSSMSTLFAWLSICLAHIRYRRGLKVHGITLDHLSYKAVFGTFGSWIGLLINLAVICFEFWVALYPIGKQPDAETFFKTYLSVPVVLATYLFHKVWKRTPLFIRAKDMDIYTGARNDNVEENIARSEQNKLIMRQSNWFKRLYLFWC